MTTAACIPASDDLGETTLRMVLEFLPDSCPLDAEGRAQLSPEALRLGLAIKGLRGQHAGERTIRRVLQGPESAFYAEMPGTSKIIPLHARRAGWVRNEMRQESGYSLAAEIEAQETRRREALSTLDGGLDRLEESLRMVAGRERYGGLLGNLASLQGLLHRRARPLGPGDLA